MNVIHAKFEHNSDKIKVTVADHMKEDKRSKKPNGKLLDLREQGAKKALQREGLTLKQGETFVMIHREFGTRGIKWQIDRVGSKGLWTVRD